MIEDFRISEIAEIVPARTAPPFMAHSALLAGLVFVRAASSGQPP
jgi:hypothetical protein